MTNTLGHWGVLNHIGVIKEDLGPCEVLDFMGDIGVSRKQTLPKPGEETRHIEDRNVQGLYMDAYQDYSSMKRKIVKPARKWSASKNKPKEFKFSANTNQNTPPNGIFCLWKCTRRKDRSKCLLFCTTRNAKSSGTSCKSGTNRQESRSLVWFWKF